MYKDIDCSFKSFISLIYLHLFHCFLLSFHTLLHLFLLPSPKSSKYISFFVQPSSGRDTLVKSQTGSGKTLAYALPIINSLMTRDPKVDRIDGPYALVIVPTRELVLQGYETFNKLCAGCTWIVPGQLMGGENKKSEKARLRKGLFAF